MKKLCLLNHRGFLTCALLLLYTTNLCSLNIDIKQLFGTWQCLKDDKKYLSPLNGAICAETGWTENMYRFGEVDTEVVLEDGRQVYKKREESKKLIQGNATSELVFMLFNAFPNIEGLQPSKAPASPAALLTPTLIGQLLNEIEKLIGSQCHILLDLSNKKEFNEIMRKAKQSFKDPLEKRSDYQKIKSELNTLKNAKSKDQTINDQINVLLIKLKAIKEEQEQSSQQAFVKHTQEALKTNSEKIMGQLDGLFDICDKNIKIVLSYSDAHNIVDGILTLFRKNNIPSEEHFLQLILKSLVECGFLKLEIYEPNEQKGPLCIGSSKYYLVVPDNKLPKNKLPILQELQFMPYTTHNVLLSLLAMKLNKSKDINDYFSVFAPTILKNNQQLCKQLIEDDKKQFEKLKISKNYEKELEQQCAGKNIQDCYELIACTELEMLNPLQAPNQFVYGTAFINIEGKPYSFSDCTETALLNFFNLMLTKLGLYDWENKRFKLDDEERVNKAIALLIKQEAHVKKAPKQEPTQKEIDLRKKSFLPDNFRGFFLEDLWKDAGEVHNAWAQLISNKSNKGLIYLNNNIYELKPHPDNFVAAFKYLCGSTCDTFDQICSVLEIYDDDNKNIFSLEEFDKNKKYEGKATWRISKDFRPLINVTFNISFDPGHAVFAVSRNEGKSTSFIKTIFKESKTNQLLKPLTYLYAYRTIELDQRLELIDFSKTIENKLANFRDILYGYDFGKNRTRLMNLVEWLYGTEEQLSDKKNLITKLNEYKDSDGDTLLNLAIVWNKDKIAKVLIEHGIGINEKNNQGSTPLHRAAFRGKLEIVDLLIKRGANIDEKNKNGDTPLYFAALNEEWRMAAHLIKLGAILNEKNDKGETLLDLATVKKIFSNGEKKSLIEAIKSKSSAAEFIAACNIGINEKDEYGNTSLHLAISYKQPEVSKILIDQLIKDKANLNEKNNEGNTPLHLALEQYQKKIVTMLLEQLIKDKANLNEKNNEGNTPLHLALAKYQTEVVKILIDQLIKDKANLNEKNNEGNTSLHLAISYKQPEVAKILIDQLIKDKANLNEKNNEGNTPLHLALEQYQSEIAKMLIDQLIKDRANLNKKNKNGDTPLHLAINNKNWHIAAYLVKNGLNVNEKNNSSETPLELTKKILNTEKLSLVDTLLSNNDAAEFIAACGIGINEKDLKGNTTLHLAISNGQMNVAKEVIEQITKTHSDLNVQNGLGDTALHTALYDNQPDIAQVLIAQLINVKANLNTQNNENYTPLHLAIIQNQPVLVKSLIEQITKTHSDLNVSNKWGRTALHEAIMNEQLETSMILIDQLIKDKANLNKQSITGNTPLHLAIIHNLPEIAKILIDQLIKDKADLNIQNKNNETPLDLARNKGHNDIVKLLEKGMKQTK